MEVGSLFFLLAIIVVVLIIITQPFYLAGRSLEGTKLAAPDDSLEEAEYQGIVRAIREINTDFELGKLTGEDFDAQRKVLEDQAFRWMRKNQGTTGDDLAADASQGSEIEQMIHSRRMERSEQTAGFCPKCGKPVQKSDQFCPTCGEPTRLYL